MGEEIKATDKYFFMLLMFVSFTYINILIFIFWTIKIKLGVNTLHITIFIKTS